MLHVLTCCVPVIVTYFELRKKEMPGRGGVGLFAKKEKKHCFDYSTNTE